MYSVTVVPAGALPVIRGALSLAGEAGFVPEGTGARGGVESSTYVRPAEQADAF